MSRQGEKDILQQLEARRERIVALSPRTCAGRALWTFLVPGAAARVYWKGDHGAYRPFSAQ